MNPTPYFFVFDVESVGLHGQPFAYGYAVIDAATGEEHEHDCLKSPFDVACIHARHSDVEWVRLNVLPELEGVREVDHARDMRAEFLGAWKRWEAIGALLAADCPWPVEARFLMQCVRYTRFLSGRDADGDRQRHDMAVPGPYPLIDIASVRLAKGLDPLAAVPRLVHEQPAHNPLADARQSARLLVEALNL